ncbi:MAG TPA: twin-arginine translocation signal domain-containing protein [Oscillospiraceae bacterium]|nr:twin-arginine translocation signal domain-containing protein [Oscillospiraceae bacterium]
MAVKEKELTRRKFIKGAGATLAVTALSAGLGGFLTGCSKPTEETTGEPNGQPVDVTWPLAYHQLDSAKAEEIAYNSYKSGAG